MSSLSTQTTAKSDIPSDAEMSIGTGRAEQEPDGGYGWVVVVSSFLINAHTWGINASYGVFLAAYLSKNVYPGTSNLAYAFTNGLSFSMAMFVSPLATMTTGRFGTHTCLFIGVVLQTTALIGASFSKKFWQLLLSQGFCFGWGMGFLFVGIAGISSQWFTRKRSLANGLSTSGSGFGGLVYSLAANAMIQRLGLAWAFRILGIVSGAVNLVSAILIRDRNAHIGTSQLPFDYRLLKRPEFVLVQIYGFFNQLAYVVLLFSLPNYANNVGLSSQQGSIVGALLCLGTMFGRGLMGYLSDHAGPINVTVIATLLNGIYSLAFWHFATSYGVLLFFALLTGLTAGTYWVTIPPICAEIVGLKNLNAALSISFFLLVTPLTFSEPIALEITSSTGSYLGTQLFTGFMYIISALCLWVLKAWKVADLEKPNELQRVMTRGDTSEAKWEMKLESNFLRRLFCLRKV